MSDHTHSQYVEGCYRCDLSRDEVANGYVADEMVEKGREGVAARLGWASIHWGAEGLHADAIPHIARAALSAVVPAIVQAAKAEAWDEGHAAGCADPYAKYGECGCGPNPYRERGES